MRKLYVLLALIIIAFSAYAPMAAAQTTESVGCATLDGTILTGGVYPKTFDYDFAVGELLNITVSGAGSFDITVNGELLAEDVVTESTVNYSVPADGAVSVEIANTTSDTTSTVEFECFGVDEIPTYAPGTLCHIPPGNPNAAHTIRVGLPAVETHLGHGDTEGPCPDGVDTEYDNPSIGVTIFIIYATGEIQVYGNCTDTCDELGAMPITLIVNLNLLVVNTGDDDDDSGEFMEVENPEDYGFEISNIDAGDGISVVIYYLHPDPENTSVGVFQINIYKDGVLVDDGVLLFITTDGTIILWTGHDVWDEDED